MKPFKSIDVLPLAERRSFEAPGRTPSRAEMEGRVPASLHGREPPAVEGVAFSNRRRPFSQWPGPAADGRRE